MLQTMEHKAKQLAFDTLFSYLTVNFYWMDKEGYLQGCNENVLKTFNLSSLSQYVGKHILDLPRTPLEVWENCKKVMASKTSLVFEESYMNHDGNILNFLTTKSPIFDEVTGEIVGVVGVSVDITTKKKLEKATILPFKVTKLAFESLFHHLPITFYWMDKEGYLKGCNEKLLHDMHLQSLSQFIDKHVSVIANETAWENSQQVMASKQSCFYEETHRNNDDGSNITYLSIKSPILDEDTGECIGLVGIAIDITERKRMEEELRIAKEKAEAANKAKAEFIASMSHDLRTPFGGILSATDFLYETETDEGRKMLLNEARVSSRHLLDLLNQILEVISEKRESVKIDKCNLQEILQSVRSLLKPQVSYKDLHLTIHCNDLPMETDRSRLLRIILNLTNNALKFTVKGGVDIYATDYDHYVEICIIDTGVGIPEDKLEEIFKPFTLLKGQNIPSDFKGAGLGLHIVKTFLQDIGGSVSVTSELGKGSCFKLKVPKRLDPSRGLKKETEQNLFG